MEGKRMGGEIDDAATVEARVRDGEERRRESEPSAWEGRGLGPGPTFDKSKRFTQAIP